jgi:hypothetical protein
MVSDILVESFIVVESELVALFAELQPIVIDATTPVIRAKLKRCFFIDDVL